jgi:hypothetical protein
MPRLKMRPEPRTPAEIREEIEFLESQLNGQLDGAIQDRIERLKERLCGPTNKQPDG